MNMFDYTILRLKTSYQMFFVTISVKIISQGFRAFFSSTPAILNGGILLSMIEVWKKVRENNYYTVRSFGQYRRIYIIYIHIHYQVGGNFLIFPLTFPIGLSSVLISTYASPFSIFLTNSLVFFPSRGPFRSFDFIFPLVRVPLTSPDGVSDLYKAATTSPFSLGFPV